MSDKETAQADFPEPSLEEFYSAIGLDRRQGQKTKEYLEERVMKILQSFPFADPDTSILPILTIVYPQDGQSRLILPAFPDPVPAGSVEKIMDNILISRSKFTERHYTYGPVKRTYARERGENYQEFYETYDFPVCLEGERTYIVRKGTEYIKRVRADGNGFDKKVKAIHYFASLQQDSLTA